MIVIDENPGIENPRSSKILIHLLMTSLNALNVVIIKQFNIRCKLINNSKDIKLSLYLTEQFS